MASVATYPCIKSERDSLSYWLAGFIGRLFAEMLLKFIYKFPAIIRSKGAPGANTGSESKEGQ